MALSLSPSLLFPLHTFPLLSEKLDAASSAKQDGMRGGRGPWRPGDLITQVISSSAERARERERERERKRERETGRERERERESAIYERLMERGRERQDARQPEIVGIAFPLVNLLSRGDSTKIPSS